ncbi:MAG TPA: hypothetical protein VK846_05580 [Candidatus Limnocylindria bacterium]|nr:hypothetical protein [Candidatus Limnocylindria bacterium]
MTTRRSLFSFLALIAVALLGTGCVTNGRRILLKEYGASVPVVATNSLKGATICLKGFESVPNLVAFELKTKPQELDGFKYMDFTREQDKQWDKEWRALEKQKGNVREIGNMRNGFGMVMSHVYALNDPAAWLVEGLRFDLEAQGAKVVDASQAADADVTLGGMIQLCRVDMYITVDGSLVVDLDVQPKAGAPRHKQIHTHGATVAVLASEGEYLHALRDARQKFSILVTREIAQALKPGQ